MLKRAVEDTFSMSGEELDLNRKATDQAFQK